MIPLVHACSATSPVDDLGKGEGPRDRFHDVQQMGLILRWSIVIVIIILLLLLLLRCRLPRRSGVNLPALNGPRHFATSSFESQLQCNNEPTCKALNFATRVSRETGRKSDLPGPDG